MTMTHVLSWVKEISLKFRYGKFASTVLFIQNSVSTSAYYAHGMSRVYFRHELE